MDKISLMEPGDYEDRLRRVTNYIYDHLDQEIDLFHLAKIACLSPFHWHRIYRAVYGETITSTVKRLRMSHAAADLANTLLPVQEIANRVGYNNLQSFTRLFKATYGLPPAQYRQRGSHTFFQAPFIAENLEAHPIGIEILPERTLIGLTHKGSYMDIGNTYDKLFGILGNRSLDWSKVEMIALYLDDPEAVPEPKLISKACLKTTEENLHISSGLEKFIIPAGRYAVLRHKGPYSDMHNGYQWLYGEWLINSGEEAADAPAFEKYYNNPRDTDPSELLTDIHLPLISK